MARRKHEVLVCDVCGSDDDVTAVTVTVDGAERRAELCAAHRQQLQQAVAGLLGTAEPSRPGRRARKIVAGGAAAGTRATPKRAARVAEARKGTARNARMPTTTCPHCGVEMGVQNLSRHIAAKHPDA